MQVGVFLHNALEQALSEESGLFLVHSSYKEEGSKYLFVIDGDEGFTIGQCGKLSRRMMRAIEENPSIEAQREHFSFEVASPGAEAPLVLLRQYAKHVGRELEVETLAGEKIRARLEGVTADALLLRHKILSKVKGRKDKDGEQVQVPYSSVKESKIILSFK
jgi:ribosome maturation factor RimP